MQLTPRATETLIRRLASASKAELEQALKEATTTQRDTGQPWRVRDAARELAKTLRKLIKEL